MYHDKATPWLRRGVSDQGRKATSVETSRITPICIHLFTHLSILHSFIQLTNLSECIFVLIFWLVWLVRLEFIFLQKLWVLLLIRNPCYTEQCIFCQRTLKSCTWAAQAESSANAFPVQQYVPHVKVSIGHTSYPWFVHNVYMQRIIKPEIAGYIVQLWEHTRTFWSNKLPCSHVNGHFAVYHEG